jgi:hypothetical protein
MSSDLFHYNSHQKAFSYLTSLQVNKENKQIQPLISKGTDNGTLCLGSLFFWALPIIWYLKNNKMFEDLDLFLNSGEGNYRVWSSRKRYFHLTIPVTENSPFF